MYEEFYKKVKNPLDKENFLTILAEQKKKIEQPSLVKHTMVETTYNESDRQRDISNYDYKKALFYSEVVGINSFSSHECMSNTIIRNHFFAKVYQYWLEDLKEMSKQNAIAKQIYNFLLSSPKVETKHDLNALFGKSVLLDRRLLIEAAEGKLGTKVSPIMLIEEADRIEASLIAKFGLNNEMKKVLKSISPITVTANSDFHYIASRKTPEDYRTTLFNDSHFDHRFYINIKPERIYEFLSIFLDKCREKELPYYFKFEERGGNHARADTLVIYTKQDNLLNYYEALKEMEKENPELKDMVGKPALLVGEIDGWIGYGEDAHQEGQSYSSTRSDIFYDAMDEALIEALIKNEIEITDKKVIKSLQEYVLDAAFKMEDRDCARKNFLQIINELNLKCGCKPINYDKNNPYNKTHFTNTKKVMAPLYNILPALMGVPNFKAAVEAKVQEKMYQAGIDINNCAFNQNFVMRSTKATTYGLTKDNIIQDDISGKSPERNYGMGMTEAEIIEARAKIFTKRVSNH